MNIVAPQAVATALAQKLREHPEIWKQRTFYDPKTHGGCLFAMIFVECERQKANCQMVCRLFREKTHSHIITWNDKPGRTVEEVIRLCEEIANE